MVDPSVSTMVSRDLDSRLTGREAAAVSQWLTDPQQLPFHVMRDNPQHGTEILGGMWGARMDTGYRNKFREIMEVLLENVSKTKNYSRCVSISMYIQCKVLKFAHSY